MRITLVLFVLLLAMSTAVTAKDSVKKINYTMTKIGKEIQVLFPYMFNKDKFEKAENEKKIGKKISKVTKLLKDASEHFEKSPLTYVLNHKVIVDHMEETEQVFKEGNKDYAQLMLKASTHLCMNCHTQDKEDRKLFYGISRGNFDNDFEFAEFNFMTRNYNKALKYYDQFLKGSKDQRKVKTSLRRKLTIFADIQKTPDRALVSFEKDINQTNISKMNKDSVLAWMDGFRKWKKSDELKIKKINKEEVNRLVKKFLFPLKMRSPFHVEGINLVTYVRLRGILNEYLMTEPEEAEMPKILYWLALSDRALNYNVFYSMGNTYLKACMRYYNKYPEVKDCYNEYEENVIFSYTGSAGTHLPKDVQMELDEFKKLLKGMPKEKK
jgi:hypothetical protein